MIRSCNPPLPDGLLTAMCECGHLGSEHRRDMPSPCGVGWDLDKQVVAMESATGCKISAMADETERQRAAGACQCIGFQVAVTMQDIADGIAAVTAPDGLYSMHRKIGSILVCGGRDYADRAKVYATLDEIGPTEVVHGACGADGNNPQWERMKGADRLADDWCLERGIVVHRMPAHWKVWGKKAGPIRNQAMLDRYQLVLDFVVAFPGGVWTSGMIRISREAELDVIEVAP